MQLRLACALGDAEHLRRLTVGVAIERVQHQRIARPFGQLADRALDLLYLDGRFQRPLGTPAFLLFGWRLDGSALATLRQAHVDRDAVQPGRQRAACLELAERAPCVDERLLRTILRELRIARHAQTQSVDSPHMLAIEPLESAPVPGAGSLNERRLPVDPRFLGLRVCHLSL